MHCATIRSTRVCLYVVYANKIELGNLVTCFTLVAVCRSVFAGTVKCVSMAALYRYEALQINLYLVGLIDLTTVQTKLYMLVL